MLPYCIVAFGVIVGAAQYQENYITFNHRLNDQYLKMKTPKPTQQGPVLFPNDAPPPPRPPLIVTSRPLTDSIARSELNATEEENGDKTQPHVTESPLHNSIAEPSINQLQYRRNYIDNAKGYNPYSYFVTPSPSPVVFLDSVTGRPVGYSGVYHDPYDYMFGHTPLETYDRQYDKPTPLPPIYKVFSHHANHKLARVQENNARERQKQVDLYKDYQSHSDYPHTPPHEHNRVDNGENEYDQNSNYAFSYTVRDQKTGDDFSHTQQSKGSATNGEYRVRLPDGRTQIVSYTADENGYKADVRYDDDQNTEYEDPTRKDYVAKIDQRLKSYEYDDKIQANLYKNYESENDKYNKQDDYNDREYKVEESSQESNTDGEAPNDYYNEYEYAPPHRIAHESKFTHLTENNKKIGVIVVPDKKPLVPSYEELKTLFEPKEPVNDFIYKDIPVEHNVPSTTSNLVETTTEHVVLIGGSNKFNDYVSPSLSPQTYQPSPSSYLASTIAGLRKNIDFSGPRPTFSSSFIDRINRYLKS